MFTMSWLIYQDTLSCCKRLVHIWPYYEGVHQTMTMPCHNDVYAHKLKNTVSTLSNDPEMIYFNPKKDTTEFKCENVTLGTIRTMYRHFLGFFINVCLYLCTPFIYSFILQSSSVLDPSWHTTVTFPT